MNTSLYSKKTSFFNSDVQRGQTPFFTTKGAIPSIRGLSPLVPLVYPVPSYMPLYFLGVCPLLSFIEHSLHKK